MAELLIPLVYLETTLFNLYFDTEPKNAALREWTRRFFASIRRGYYQPFTSDYVAEELKATPDSDREKRDAMLALIDDYGIKTLPDSADAENLVDRYIKAKAFTSNHIDDAFHVAMATVYGLSFVVSYNFRHISRPFTRRLVKVVNRREGYQPVYIIAPRGIERCRGMKF